MFKVLSVVSTFAVLWISATLCDECLNQNQVWGGADPNVFYYCDTSTNQSVAVECPEGKGFVNNGTASGCIPWEDWNDNCISKVDVSDINCGGNTYLSPSAAGDPGVFYICTAQNATPVELNCPAGRGFYDRNGYLGCYPWELWRNITGCIN